MKAAVAFVLALAACGSKPSLIGSDAGSGSAVSDGGGLADAPTSMPGDPVASLQAMPGNCSSDGWCWLAPTPNGNDYLHVAGTGSDNLWLIGWATVLQWDGATWTQHHPPVVAGESPGEIGLMIDGHASNDMWLVYETSLEHWDGSAWSIEETLSLGGNPRHEGMWDDPAGDLWVTYSTGDIKRWHGDTPTTLPPCGCAPFAIWGTSPSDVFVTTLPPGVMHYDGSAWTQIYGGPDVLGGFEGAPGDVWISGEQAIHHWDGSAVTTVPLTGLPSNGSLSTMGYAAADDVWWWAANSGDFVHWNGSALELFPVTAADGDSITTGARIGGRYWLAGRMGEVATMDKPGYVSRVIDGTYAWNELTGIYGTADDDMYFTVGSELRHWTGSGYADIPLDNGNPGDETELIALAGAGSELWVSGFAIDTTTELATASLFHFDGAAWSKLVIGSGTFGDQSYPLVLSIDAMGSGEAMAVGNDGFAAHFTGGAWQTLATGTTQALTGAYAPDADHVWVSGRGGTLLGWDRASPAVLTPAAGVATTNDLGPITGFGSATYAVQMFTSVLWANTGSGWVERTPEDIPIGDSGGGFVFLDATHAIASSEAQDHLYLWDGSDFVFPNDWTYEDIGATHPMPRVFRPPGGHLWAAGDSGIVLHP